MKYFIMLAIGGAILLAIKAIQALRGRPSPFLGVVFGVFLGGVAGASTDSIAAAAVVGGLVMAYGWTGGGEEP